MSFAEMIGVAICGLIFAVTVKQINSGFSAFVSAATGVVLTLYAFRCFEEPITFLREMTADTKVGFYAGTVLKLMAVGLITSVASDLCRDTGENGIAAKIELAGKGASAVIIFPVLEKLMISVKDFLL